MDETGSNWFLYLSVFLVNLMSFTANAAFSWTSPYLPKLKGTVDSVNNPLPVPINLIEETWITTFISIGALFGPLCTGKISGKLGKKMTLAIFSVPLLISNVILIFANSVLYFYISRFLAGLGIGCVYSVIPAYVAEITDVPNRGKTATLMTLMNSISHVCVVSIGPYVTIRTFACLSMIPSVLFFIVFLPIVPETPHYYMSNKNSDAAERSLKKFRQRTDVKVELVEIANSVEQTTTSGSFKDIISSKVVLRSLVITVGLMFCQQICGSQPINAYLQDIFQSTDSSIPSEIAVIIVGIAQLFTTILAVSLIDKVGRRKLLIGSFMGLLVSLISLATYFLVQELHYDVNGIFFIPILSNCLFMMFFKLGIGPVSWSIVGEIFPSNLRIYLSAVVTFCMIIFGFVVTFVFPLMFVYLGMAWTFWVFTLCTFGAILFIWIKVPEIKGKSFLEIQMILRK